MNAKKYQVTLTGVTPLLMHKDNITWGARSTAWEKHPSNKSKSVPGDDRTPAWKWIGCCYHTDKLVIDADNLMTMLRDAGKKCPASKGKGSLKAATQSGIIVEEIGWPVNTLKGFVAWKEIDALADEEDFSVHEEKAKTLGFELFVKRARVGTSKHVRVRPLFDKWSATGTILVLDTSLTKDILETLLNQGGRFVGIGDWRPGSSASGRFGMFESSIKEIK
jgi:hypothetical protein